MMTNTYLPHVGGVARSVSTFAEEYRKLKHRVLVVAPEFEGKPLSKHLAAIVERVPAIQKFNGSDFSVRLPLAAGLSDRIDEFAADIIHAHHPFLLGDTALRIAANKNVPVVFTHHTRYEDYTHYVPFDSDALKEIAISLSTEFANLCNGVIAPSESIARLIKRRGVKVPIKVVPTGIDVKSFARGEGARFRKRFKISQQAFVVGHVGRLAPEKNLPYLAEAVALFVKKNPGSIFVVVGGGPSEKALSEKFRKHKIAGQLVLAGKQTGRALHDAYRAMDLFAFASFTETQGMVLAEAMAAGCPVVALNASGVREVVRHEKNGILLPARTPAAKFAAQLTRLYRNPELRKNFSAEATVTAEEFSKENCARLALDFYQHVHHATKQSRQETANMPLGSWLKRLGVEWDLLSQKAQALSAPVKFDFSLVGVMNAGWNAKPLRTGEL